MNKRVTRKLFKNGGSSAIRVPKGWLSEDGEFDVVLREDGVLEVRPLDRAERMRKLLDEIRQRGPIPEAELPIPERPVAPERFDWNELWNGKMP